MSESRVPPMNTNEEFDWVDKLNDITYSGAINEEE